MWSVSLFLTLLRYIIIESKWVQYLTFSSYVGISKKSVGRIKELLNYLDDGWTIKEAESRILGIKLKYSMFIYACKLTN